MLTHPVEIIIAQEQGCGLPPKHKVGTVSSLLCCRARIPVKHQLGELKEGTSKVLPTFILKVFQKAWQANKVLFYWKWTLHRIYYFKNKQKPKVRQVSYQCSQNISFYYVLISSQKCLDYNSYPKRHHLFLISHFFAANWNSRHQCETCFHMYLKLAHLLVLVFQTHIPTPEMCSRKSAPCAGPQP